MPVPRPSYPMVPQAVLQSMARTNGMSEQTAIALSRLLARILDRQAIDERLNYFYIDDQLANHQHPHDHSQYIPKALVDAKGDLLVGAANDQPERLGVSVETHGNLTLLTDPNTASGLRWGRPQLPGIILRRNFATTATDAVETPISWEELVGANFPGMWTFPDQHITIQRTGRYAAWTNITWDWNGTGQRSAHIELQRGGPPAPWIVIADDHIEVTGPAPKHSNACFRVIDLNSGDRLRVTALQQTSPPSPGLDVLAAAEFSPYFGVQWWSAS